MDLDDLDAERGGPLVVREQGLVSTLPPATDLHWRFVVGAIRGIGEFVRLVWPAGAPLTFWKAPILQERWAARNGLPDAQQTDRLLYLLEHYYSGLEYDLQARLGLSLGALWRERRWREILTYIDQLPSDSHVNRLMMNDEAYIEALLARDHAPEDDAPSGPSVSEFGMINAQLATLIDAVNRNTVVTRLVAGAKNVQPMHPEPRPVTAIHRVRSRKERERHGEMVAMLLPDSAPPSG